MKNSLPAALAAATLATCALVSGTACAQTTDPLAPAGTMTAFPTIVQTGTKPTLTWSIMHPAKIGSGQTGGGNSGNGSGGGNSDGSDNMAYVNPPGTIIPTVDSYVTIQIIGTGPTNCQGGNSAASPATDLRVSLSNGTYQQLFFGTQTDVDSSKLLYIKKVLAGQTIDLGGRYVIGTGWSPFYTTRSKNLQIVALVNGDTYPSKSKFQGQASMASYLKPYIDSSFKVNIGPLSVLLVMELAQTNLSSPCFDYQDQVVLVTLSRKHPNNGHGNNLDGVDSSNPGQGKGGPNGAIDPSGGIDDEIR